MLYVSFCCVVNNENKKRKEANSYQKIYYLCTDFSLKKYLILIFSYLVFV